MCLSGRCFDSSLNAPKLLLLLLPILVATGSESKKFKDDSPSKVVHIRKLPDDITETEVISLGLPFGNVSNLLMLKTKKQVPPEFSCSSEARQPR